MENKHSIKSMLSGFFESKSSGGVILIVAALLAITLANSPFQYFYFGWIQAQLGTLTIQHWINDGLMALFFLKVGLEIKREILMGRLSSWSRRLLPCAAAAGGMLVPALIYVSINLSNPSYLRGWAIPTATDIAFALGVISLLGSRIPASLKVFLAALAISDDLGAVLIIAIFYTDTLNLVAFAAAVAIFFCLFILNRKRIKILWLYLVLGLMLWVSVFASGIHATFAGVLLALTIPLQRLEHVAGTTETRPLLFKLEQALDLPVTFLVVPIFSFANAGVSFSGFSPAVLVEPVTAGVAAGLFLGKFVGVFGTIALLVRIGFAQLPAEATWGQTAGTALLCGIGFTMSLFIGMLSFDNPAVQDCVKIGIVTGSALSGAAGAAVLVLVSRKQT